MKMWEFFVHFKLIVRVCLYTCFSVQFWAVGVRINSPPDHCSTESGTFIIVTAWTLYGNLKVICDSHSQISCISLGGIHFVCVRVLFPPRLFKVSSLIWSSFAKWYKKGKWSTPIKGQNCFCGFLCYSIRKDMNGCEVEDGGIWIKDSIESIHFFLFCSFLLHRILNPNIRT